MQCVAADNWICWNLFVAQPLKRIRPSAASTQPIFALVSDGTMRPLSVAAAKLVQAVPQRIQRPGLIVNRRRFSRHEPLRTIEPQQSLAKLDILQLPMQFLRDSDPSHFDPVTMQRNDVLFDRDNGKPLKSGPQSSYSTEIQSCRHVKGTYRIVWNDGHISQYTEAWVQQQLHRWMGSVSDRIHWSGLTEDMVRSSTTMTLPFHDLLTEEGMAFAIRALYRYGILLITETPTDTNGSAISAMASCLGGGTVKNRTTMLHSYLSGSNQLMLPRGTDGPQRTLYGTVWSTTSSGQEDGASVADSAYGHGSLPLHTDMTYLRDPPGLQIFTMLQPATRGGESLFGDGFTAAERLRSEDREAFDTLASVMRTYRCIDLKTGWHLEAFAPVILLNENQVTGIRHNDLDRLPDLAPAHLSSRQQEDFYERLVAAHDVWDRILSKDDVRLEMSMKKGDTVVVANQRCFHGRRSFASGIDTPRMVTGCYVSQDELNSRFRMEGFIVH